MTSNVQVRQQTGKPNTAVTSTVFIVGARNLSQLSLTCCKTRYIYAPKCNNSGSPKSKTEQLIFNKPIVKDVSIDTTEAIGMLIMFTLLLLWPYDGLFVCGGA